MLVDVIIINILLVLFQAHLVICDGFVVDIRGWLMGHPGGSKILENVIGTDITDGKNSKISLCFHFTDKLKLNILNIRFLWKKYY